MKKRKIIVLISIAFIGISTSFIGVSDWLLGNGNSKQYEKAPDSRIAVCKINSTYFTDIGKAIETSKSGDIIEVFPGNTDRYNSNYTISTDNSSKTLVIPQGVTLSIPYELGKANNKQADGNTNVHALGNRAQYCKSSVIIDDGITLINQGTIEIGGLIGAGAGGVPSGCTAGNYSELILGKDSILENHNTINLYGYLGEKIDDNSSFIMKPSLSNVKPTLNMPMYWYDFGGGSALKAIYDSIGQSKCLPLDDFYFENNAVKTTIYGGSDVISRVNLYASKMNGQYDLKLIGSDTSSIIDLPLGSYLETNYKEETLINDLHFYGNVNLNAMNIDIEKAIKDIAGKAGWLAAQIVGVPSKVTTDDGYFPLSYHFNITLDKTSDQEVAYYNATSNSYKLLNGSSLKIQKGVELSCKELIAYKGDDIYTSRGTHASSLKKSKTPLTAANVQINGKLIAEKIAGHFSAETLGGVIKSTVSTSVNMYEPKKGEGSNISAKMLNGEEGWFIIPFTLKLKNSNGVLEDRTIGEYKCVSDECYWEATSYLSAISIKETSNNYESGKRQDATFNIVADFFPNNYIDEIESFEWKQKRHDTSVSYDGTFENPTLNSVVFKTVKNKNLINDNYIDVWLEVRIKGKQNVIKSNVITFKARH